CDSKNDLMSVHTLGIAVWNSNGLLNHYQEIKTVLVHQRIDIMLISETHFTNRRFIRIPDNKVYDTKHPDGTAHGGTAVIIRDSIKHHETNKFQEANLQSTSVIVKELSGPITISAFYC